MKFRAAILLALCLTLYTWSQRTVTVPPLGQDISKLKEAWNKPTSGTSLEMKELQRLKTKKATATAFRLVATGVSPEKKYDVWVWISDKDPVRIDSNVQFDNAGTVLQSSDRQPFTLWFAGMSKGEAARVALVSDDQQVVASAKKIPFPIEVANGSCHVALEQSFWGKLSPSTGQDLQPTRRLRSRASARRSNCKLRPKLTRKAPGRLYSSRSKPESSPVLRRSNLSDATAGLV